MSYININEVDKTIQNLAPATNDNITYVPLNSSDGPSGQYIVVSNYSDFVQLFGTDPNPESALMTSWDYAANLLLRNMPVMVRRITSYIDDNGNDDIEKGYLPGVSRASGLLKVAEVTGMVEKAQQLVETDLSYRGSVPNESNSQLTNGVKTQLKLLTSVDATANKISIEVNPNIKNNGQGSTFNINEDTNVNRTVSGNYTITNSGVGNVFVYGMSLISRPVSSTSTTITVFNLDFSKFAKDSNKTLADAIKDTNFQITDGNNKNIDLKNIKLSWDDEDKSTYFELAEDWKITYNESLSNVEATVIVKTNDDNGIVNLRVLDSPSGYYDFEFSKETMKGVTAAYPVISEDTDVDNASEFDNHGNINLLKLYYRYPGSNGSRLKASIKTIDGDGIYLQVWNSSQRLENIQLVSLRYKNPSGLYAKYDLYNDKNKIWQLFLNNFMKNVTLPITNKENIVTYPITSNYLTIEINRALDFNCYDYLDSIYLQRGNIMNSLTGGSNPNDDDVIHEVKKTYSPLKDKYLYDIKFISNGGYVDEIVSSAELTVVPQIKHRYIEESMIDLAESRGDCLALVDIPFDIDKEDAVQYFQQISTSYATAYAPWVQFNLLTRTTRWCPPSFAALWTIARSVSTGNPVYAPPAGVNRANMPEVVDLSFVIPSEYIDYWQDNYIQFINPIVYINGYGVNIFGQRTLYNQVESSYNNTSALQYLNVRLVANEIKKRIFKTCIELTFEYNNLHTWLSFKSKMSELLENLLYNNHITSYDVVMDETTMTDTDIRSNHIVGTVSVSVSNTAEKFDITFELLPNQVNFINLDYSVDDAYGYQGASIN